MIIFMHHEPGQEVVVETVKKLCAVRGFRYIDVPVDLLGWPLGVPVDLWGWSPEEVPPTPAILQDFGDESMWWSGSEKVDQWIELTR